APLPSLPSAVRSPGPLLRRGDVIAVGRSEAKADAGINELGMRVIAAVKFTDRLGIDDTRFRVDQRALLEMRLEETLRADEEGCAVMELPIGLAPRQNFGAEDKHLGFRIARQRGIDGIEQNVSLVLFTWLEKAIEMKLQVFVLVELDLHAYSLLFCHQFPNVTPSEPRVAHPVMRCSIATQITYIPTPIRPVTIKPANANGTSKRDDATSIRWPMPALAATVSATIEPTKATVIAIFSEAKK